MKTKMYMPNYKGKPGIFFLQTLTKTPVSTTGRFPVCLNGYGVNVLGRISQQCKKKVLFTSRGIIPLSWILIVWKTKDEAEKPMISNEGTRAQTGTWFWLAS